MNCQNCGSPLTTEDQFCKNCGAAVNNQPAQNINPINTSVDANSMGTVPSQPQSVAEPSTVIQVGNPAPVEPVAPIPQVVSQPVQPATSVTPVMPQPQVAPQSTIAQPVKNGSKNNLVLIIVGAVAALAIIALAIVFVPKLFHKNDGGNGGNNTVTSTTSTYKVNYAGFTFAFPDDFKYEERNGELLIADSSEVWVLDLIVANGDYNQYKNNLGNLQNFFEQKGYVSAPAELKTINGTEFITAEMQNSGINMLGAYVKLNSMNFAFMLIYNQDNTYAYDILNKVEPIMKNAIYNAAANNISASNLDNINMFDLVGMY